MSSENKLEKQMEIKKIDDLRPILADYEMICDKLCRILQDKDMENLDKQGYVMCWGFWTEKATGVEYIVARYWDVGSQDNYLLRPEWLFMPIEDVRVAWKERMEKLKRGER